MHIADLPLKSVTPVAWTEVVLSDFDRFLIDHAACERKASALCMSLICKYPDRPALVDPMVSLAREELQHFREVYKLLERRGLQIAPDEKDPYVNLILRRLRNDREGLFLDRLVASGVIEARGCERFHLLAQHLQEPSLKDFYSSLARSEAGHFRVFTKLAELYFSADQVQEAIERIATIEAETTEAVPFRAALH